MTLENKNNWSYLKAGFNDAVRMPFRALNERYKEDKKVRQTEIEAGVSIDEPVVRPSTVLAGILLVAVGGGAVAISGFGLGLFSLYTASFCLTVDKLKNPETKKAYWPNITEYEQGLSKKHQPG